ncbi:MAG: NAD(P)H-dependent oxidoreductase [Clostridia bacterium]|nr:NAD(P)H-dependent oxidoreductase [Clostridia bacterium]
MKILVINGSPKSKYSVTLQTVNYLAVLYPEHTFDILHAGHTIKALEKDFSAAKTAMESADLLLFSYPVYTFIAPCQLHRFIELTKEYDVNLSGKFVTQITTSKHFYDITAHRYIADNCKDLGMKYIRGLSADMDDLLTEKGQNDAKAFFDYVCFSITNDIYENVPVALPSPAHKQTDVCEGGTEKSGDVVIVTDCEEENTQLKNMIERFSAVLPKATRVVNLREYPFSGGCLGCFNCASDGKCIYKDGFDEFLRTKIQTAEAIIYAFSIKDHSMGALFKMYDDRQFCNGHRTVTMGMPMGYLVSGDLSREENLRTILEARAEVGNNFLCGIATDEYNPNNEIDAMAKKLCYALEHKYVPPQNFYGIGGMKIFRDLIWLMRGMMKADHKFYKTHGQYDFPQKKRGTILKMYLVGALISNKKIKAKMGNAMNEGMLAPYNKLLEKVKRENDKSSD